MSETITSAEQITDESVAAMNGKSLIDSIIYTYDMGDIDRARIQALMKIRAKELKLGTEVSQMIKAYAKADRLAAEEFTKSHARKETKIPLAYDSNDKPKNTIDNILLIMRNDSRYAEVKYNLLTNAPEINERGKIRRWSDTDEAESKRYIEKKYDIHNETKHYDALRILFREREYHPIRDIIDKLTWDGTDRIESFLTEWLKADDTPYTREVSRLIFAGGINRLYNPGCKFDDVPVLIGTSQGEGKSTIVRWLAMKDEFYSEVTEIEGQRSIEQLEGAWMCEIAELLALTKAKEQEAVKSYITRQRDKYRRPYDRQTTEYPRRCVFLGTTNNEQFLKDKTGNRRFYPVKVKSSGYELYDKETECRAYIEQCWAEAKVRYDKHKMSAYANETLRDDYKAAQEDAMEDDWRIGAIESFLSKKDVLDFVCVKEIMTEALSPNPDFPKDLTPKECREVGMIVSKLPEWQRAGTHLTEKYGRQKCWQRIGDGESDYLPF